MAGREAVHISTRSGRVRVVASDGGPLTVRGGHADRTADGFFEVVPERSSSSIEVHCATGTDLTIGTVSGSVECTGILGAVRIATVSGKVSVEAAAQLDVRTRSGSVEVGAVSGECRVTTTSAKVVVASARHARLANVSGVVFCGDVDEADVKTVSGKVALSTKADARASRCRRCRVGSTSSCRPRWRRPRGCGRSRGASTASRYRVPTANSR